MARLVLAGYVVRHPLGGYAWQAAHYLLGLRALGHDVWFYEETAHYAPAFNPTTGWVNPDVIGIDVGMTILSAENLRSGNIWKWFMRNPEIGRALELSEILPEK